MTMAIVKKEKPLSNLCYGLSLQEFNCKCDMCDATIYDRKLLQAYGKFRYLLGVPIIITCGYRCPYHNKEIGGAKLSRHILGQALDMGLKEILQVLKTTATIKEKLIQCGFTYVEINVERGYIHADVRGLT